MYGEMYYGRHTAQYHRSIYPYVHLYIWSNICHSILAYRVTRTQAGSRTRAHTHAHTHMYTFKSTSLSILCPPVHPSPTCTHARSGTHTFEHAHIYTYMYMHAYSPGPVAQLAARQIVIWLQSRGRDIESMSSQMTFVEIGHGTVSTASWIK